MTVSREYRNAAAEALTPFLRGEINYDALRDRFGTILDSTGGELIPDEFVGNLLYAHANFSRGPITKKIWTDLRKALAFLKTDLEAPQYREPAQESRYSAEIVQARWHLLGIAIAFCLTLLVGWWIFFAASVLSWIIIQVREWRRDSAFDKALRTERERFWRCFPFLSEEERVVYETALDEMSIPKSYPGRGPASLSTRIGEVVGAVFETVLFVIFVPFIFMFFILIPLFCWPIYLVVTSLQRRQTPPTSIRCSA